MSEAPRILFRDRLRDRGFIDQWGFLFFALGGGAAVFGAKWYGVLPRWVLIGAVCSMLLYAGLIGLTGTGRLWADQAGDNCYYLGLIYTLASLSYSITTFDPDNSASTIVQGFGIALATTILGLVLRVFFNQGRPDMENVEETARLELTEATARLKGELATVVRHVNDLARQLVQSMQEVQEAASRSMQDFSNTSVQGIRDVSSAASEAIRAEANDFAVRSKKYTTTFNGLLSKLDDYGSRLEATKESHDSLLAAARAASDVAASTVTSVDSMSQSTSDAASAASSAKDAAAAAVQIMEQLQSSTAGLQTTLHAISETTERQLAELRKGPANVVGETAAKLTEVINILQAQVGQLSEAHEKARSALVTQGAEAVETVRQHNKALEVELRTSRDLVRQVHSALADMTRTLAETVERS